jgi:hypothetical protein
MPRLLQGGGWAAGQGCCQKSGFRSFELIYPSERSGGECRDRSTESRAVPNFGLGIVTRPRVMPLEPSASPSGPILRSGTSER